MVSGFRINKAAQVLRSGGIVAYPTEAVYGLGCDPLDYDAVDRILSMKQRPIEKGLILIASDFNQLAPYVNAVDSEIMQRVQRTWPGPFTWILPANPDTPDWITGEHNGIAVRVTAHPVAAALCSAFGGAIVSTSANKTGLPPARTAMKTKFAFPDELDYILNSATGGQHKPTPIRDAITNRTVRI